MATAPVAGIAPRLLLLSAALGGLLAVALFGSFAISGAAALLAAAIHRVIDACSQALMWRGSALGAVSVQGSEGERSFWSAVVGVALYAMGAGVVLYEAVDRLLQPLPVRNSAIVYLVLVAALVLLGMARRGTAVARIAGAPADLLARTLSIEQRGAIAGTGLALAGIALRDVGGHVRADGFAALLIGLVLAAVAALLAVEVRRALNGAMRPAITPAERAATAEPVAALQSSPSTIGETLHDAAQAPVAIRSPAASSAPPGRSQKKIGKKRRR